VLYLFILVYYETLSVAYAVYGEWLDNKLIMSWKRRERRRHGLTWDGPGFSWRNWGKPLNSSVRISGLQAQIWTRDLTNTLHSTTTFHLDLIVKKRRRRTVESRLCDDSRSQDPSLLYRLLKLYYRSVIFRHIAGYVKSHQQVRITFN
jgi:hypothetical protein